MWNLLNMLFSQNLMFNLTWPYNTTIRTPCSPSKHILSVQCQTGLCISCIRYICTRWAATETYIQFKFIYAITIIMHFSVGFHIAQDVCWIFCDKQNIFTQYAYLLSYFSHSVYFSNIYYASNNMENYVSLISRVYLIGSFG